MADIPNFTNNVFVEYVNRFAAFMCDVTTSEEAVVKISKNNAKRAGIKNWQNGEKKYAISFAGTDIAAYLEHKAKLDKIRCNGRLLKLN